MSVCLSGQFSGIAQTGRTFVFFFFLMSFVFCDSYYSTGALCTKFTLVDIESFVSVFIIVKCMPWNDEMCGIVVECIVKL
jgi:hypothetical protein